MAYIWILVVLIAVLVGIFFWLERRHEHALKDFVKPGQRPAHSGGAWGIADIETDVDDTAPAVLDHQATSERWRHLRRG